MNQPLRLLRETLSQQNDLKQLVLLGKACKLISDLLIIEKKEQLPFDTDLFKHLLICSVLNQRSVLYLVEALLQKYRDRVLFICYIWNAAQFIATLEEKNDKRLEGSFLSNNILRVKQNTLKLLPSLFSVSIQKPGLSLSDKMDIFKLFNKNTKSQLIQSQVLQLAGIIKQKYCTPKSKQSQKAAERKVGSILFQSHELTRTVEDTFDLLTLESWLAKEARLDLNQFQYKDWFKKEDHLRTLLTFVVFPDETDVLEQLWPNCEDIQPYSRNNIRSLQTTLLLSQPQNIMTLLQLNTEACNLYFRLLQQLFKKIDKRTIIINHITDVLQSFLLNAPGNFIAALSKYKILRGIYIYLQNQFVFSLFNTILSPFSANALPPAHFLRLVDVLQSLDFFKQLLHNTYRKDFSILKKKQNSKSKDKQTKKELQQELREPWRPPRPDISLVGLSDPKSIDQQSPDCRVRKTSTRSKSRTVKIKTLFVDQKEQKKKGSSVQRISISQDHVLGSMQAKHKPTEQIYRIMSRLIYSYCDTLKDKPKAYGYNRQKIRAQFSLRKEVILLIEQEHKEMAGGVGDWCLTNSKLLLMLVNDILTLVDLASSEFTIKHYQLLFHKLIDPAAFPFMVQNYFTKLMLQVCIGQSLEQTLPLGSIIGRLLTLLLSKLNLTICQPLRISLLQALINQLPAFQNMFILLFNLDRQIQFVDNEPLAFRLGKTQLQLTQLFKWLLLRVQSRAALVQRTSNCVWQILIIWFLDSKYNSLFQVQFVQILRITLDVCSQAFLSKLLFKLGLLTSLYEAFEDNVRNNVVMSHWNVENFLAAIKQVFTLIERSVRGRSSEFGGLRQNLAKFYSWQSLTKLPKLQFSMSEANFSLADSRN